MDIAVTGSSGLIGTALVEALEARGDRVVRMVRRRPGPSEIRWDPAAGRIDSTGLNGLDAVVHLAGAGIGDRRWTDEYKQSIRTSRVDGTRLLAEALAGLARPPKVLVSQSGIGYYGDRADEVLTESSSRGHGFLAEVVSAWEDAAEPARRAGIRVVHPRTAPVLTPRGGSLAKQLPLFRIGLGGRFGSGEQWWSWISLDDQVAATLHLLGSGLEGPVNLSAPNPVQNREFARALGRALRRPAVLPVPAFGPKLVVGGELAESLLFGSQRVIPERLVADGFEFSHPSIEGALDALVERAA
jgi:uncharacterized protein